MSPRPTESASHARVKLTRGGLDLGGEILPLYAGSVHYWHMEPSTWRPALEAVKSLGFGLVDTYVPWGVHERAPGALGRDTVVDPVLLPKLLQQAGVTQHLQVPGNAGLALSDDAGQFGDRKLAPGEHGQQAQSGRLGGRSKVVDHVVEYGTHSQI